MLTLLIKAVIDDALNKNFKKKHRKDWKAIKNNNKNTKHKKKFGVYTCSIRLRDAGRRTRISVDETRNKIVLIINCKKTQRINLHSMSI